MEDLFITTLPGHKDYVSGLLQGLKESLLDSSREGETRERLKKLIRTIKHLEDPELIPPDQAELERVKQENFEAEKR